MKFATVWLLMLCFQATYAQKAHVTLNLNQVTLKKALKTIESKCDYTFLYNDGEMDMNRKVTINALRKRVGMTGMLNMNDITTDPNWDFKSISPVLNEIRRERKVELALEGFRMDDICRWAAADEVIVNKKPKGAYKAQWKNYPNATTAFTEAWQGLAEDANGYIDPFGKYPAMDKGYQFNVNRDYLSPISTEELTLNPELKQNPGWE